MKNFKGFIFLFGSSLALASFRFLSRWIESKAPLDPSIEMVLLWSAFLLSAAIGVVVMWVLDTVLIVSPKKSGLIRRILDPRSSFEGHWILKLSGNEARPYSYAHIHYDPGTDQYIYSGTGYDNEWTTASIWKCNELVFDLLHDEIRFQAEAKIYRTDLQGGRSLRNWGSITFEKPIKKSGWLLKPRYIRGRGYFIDIDEKPCEYTFTLNRIDDDFIREFFKNRREITLLDKSDLLRVYHEKLVEVGEEIPNKANAADAHAWRS